jgi:hypothetical protein
MRIIYALFDPRSEGDVRYVGKSTIPIEQRLFAHIKEAKSLKYGHLYKSHWIKNLLKEQIQPCIKILEILEVDDALLHNEREIYWIEEMQKLGHKLTNLTKGGDGGGSIGVPKTDVHKKAISQTLKGHMVTEETRKKISQTLMGKPSTSKTKFKKGITPWNKGKNGYTVDRISGSGWHHSDEAKRKIAEASKLRWQKWREENDQQN